MTIKRYTRQLPLIAGLLIPALAFCMAAIPANAQNRLQWYTFEEALSIAVKTGRPIFVDIQAPWCGWCRKMKQEVYPGLKSDLSSYVLTRLNRDDNTTIIDYKGRKLTPLRLAQKLRARTVPTVAILSPRGGYLLHITGFTRKEALRPILRYISTEAYKRQSFEAYQIERDSAH